MGHLKIIMMIEDISFKYLNFDNLFYIFHVTSFSCRRSFWIDSSEILP